MSKQDVRGTDAWIEKISVQELPALATTVRTLERLEKDDAASLARLGQSILHDHGLTSRILRVVNSATYNRGRGQVTTVSRAAVILGYNAIKHICITAKMIDGMLRNQDISPAVHERLLKLMARSLHAAMLARRMLASYDDDTREELYIATLLHNLGEIAFWSMGGPITEQLDARLRQNPADEKELVRDMLGTSFDKLGAGLATAWNMGDMLVRSIQDPERRSPELATITLAHKVSAALSDAKHNPAAVERQLKAMAEALKIAPGDVKKMIQRCTEEATELAISYGSNGIAAYLDPSAIQAARGDSSDDESPYHQPDEALQLKMLRELTFLVSEKPDINLLIHTTMEGLVRGVGMDRVVVLMPTPQRDKLLPRFFASADNRQIKQVFNLPLTNGENVFTHAFRQLDTVWVDDLGSEQWRPLLSPLIRSLADNSPFFIAPLVMDKKCLGLFYADRADSQRPLNKEDFSSFTHFVRQASLCLLLVMKSQQG